MKQDETVSDAGWVEESKTNTKPKSIQHKITPNDSIMGLSFKYGVDMDIIKRHNKLASNDIWQMNSIEIPNPGKILKTY